MKKKKGLLRKRILGKPKAKIRGVDATKVVKQVADTTDPLVREAPEKEIVADNRSFYFKDEFIKQRREDLKWLG